MEKYQEYLSYARKCEKLAASAPDQNLQREWRRLAETWRALAGERRDILKLPIGPEDIRHQPLLA